MKILIAGALGYMGREVAAQAKANGIEVACGKGSVIFTAVTPEGKGRMNAADHIRGRKVAVGDVLA